MDKIRVLLIEDDADAAALVTLQLDEACPESCLFSVDHAPTLQEGLARAAGGPYDIVLADLTLPDSRGLETVERLTAALDTPVVVLTGMEDRGLAVEALARGAQDYLVKGRSQPEGLRRAILYALERSRRRGEGAGDAAVETALGRFAHQLMSPLCVVTAALISLRESGVPPARRRLLELAEGGLARLERLARNALQLARLRAGKARPRADLLDARAVLERCCGPAGVLFSRVSRGRLQWRAAPGLPLVAADAELLEEALCNLLDNARRHARSSVVVDLRVRAGELVFAVVDDGPGVPQERLAELFEEYTRLWRAEEGGYRGTGLGLAFCRDAARLLGGRVWAEPGPGGRFFLALPLAAAPDAADTPALEHGPPRG